MPIKGGKIWFAAVAGILLGFAVYGMLQQGRSAEGSRADQSPAGVIAPAPPASNYGANSIRANRRGADTVENTPAARPDPNARRAEASRRAATNRSRTAAADPRRTERDKRRDAARAEFERQQELARQTRERALRHRQRNEAILASTTGTAPALAPADAAPAIQSAALAEADQMQADLRAQQQGGGSGDEALARGGEGAERAGDGPGSDDGSDDSSSNDPEGWDEISKLLEGLGLDESLVSLIKQVVASGVGVSNTFGGGTSTGGGDNNGSGGDNGSNGNNNGNNPPDTRPVIARWLSVTRDGCTKPELATRDLYLGFLNAPTPPIVTSDETQGLRIVDGSFFHEDTGTNGPPALLTGSCQAFDSFLTIGGVAPVFAPIPPTPSTTEWGSRLMASWFAIFGMKVDRDTARFGDNRHYVWIGRFTAEKDAFIFGQLRIDTLTTDFVDVPDWFGKTVDSVPPEPPPMPRLESLQLAGESLKQNQDTGEVSLIGGDTFVGTLRLDRPATEAGVVAFLSSNRPSQVLLPEVVEILPGSSSVEFQVFTKKLGSPASAAISATFAGQTVSAYFDVEAPSVRSVTMTKSSVARGETSQLTLWLNSPAPAGGTQVVLLHDSPGAIDAPSIVRIPEGQLRTRFNITGGHVSQPRDVELTFWAATKSYTATIEVKPFATKIDVNGDDIVNTADLGLLIAHFGTAEGAYDFNGDGVVDTADLGLLQGLFGEVIEEEEPGPGGGGNPGPGETAEIVARWRLVTPSESCENPQLEGSRTADLFLGLRARPVETPTTKFRPVLSSRPGSNLGILDGEFVQLTINPNGDAPPPPGLKNLSGFECVEYDSFLTIGGAQPTPFGVIGWGERLEGIWYLFDAPRLIQDESAFGDKRFYLWVGRFTAPASAKLSGKLRIDSPLLSTTFVDVPDWSTAAAARMDVNGDGSVSAADVAHVMRHMGANDPALDLNANGVVDGDDLRPLLNAIGEDR